MPTSDLTKREKYETKHPRFTVEPIYATTKAGVVIVINHAYYQLCRAEAIALRDGITKALTMEDHDVD